MKNEREILTENTEWKQCKNSASSTSHLCVGLKLKETVIDPHIVQKREVTTVHKEKGNKKHIPRESHIMFPKTLNLGTLCL